MQGRYTSAVCALIKSLVFSHQTELSHPEYECIPLDFSRISDSPHNAGFQSTFSSLVQVYFCTPTFVKAHPR